MVYLPPNTKSLIQPLDQGILTTFKVLYGEDYGREPPWREHHEDLEELAAEDAIIVPEKKKQKQKNKSHQAKQFLLGTTMSRCCI